MGAVLFDCLFPFFAVLLKGLGDICRLPEIDIYARMYVTFVPVLVMSALYA